MSLENGPKPVEPEIVHYIKLGRGGGWEREGLDSGIARCGYGTNEPERFNAAIEGRWADLAGEFRKAGKATGTATRFGNDVRAFFYDAQPTMWVTFSGQRLWWSFLDAGSPAVHPDGHGTFRRTKGAWRSTSVGERTSRWIDSPVR